MRRIPRGGEGKTSSLPFEPVGTPKERRRRWTARRAREVPDAPKPYVVKNQKKSFTCRTKTKEKSEGGGDGGSREILQGSNEEKKEQTESTSKVGADLVGKKGGGPYGRE